MPRSAPRPAPSRHARPPVRRSAPAFHGRPSAPVKRARHAHKR
jgi:hypothetical protein